MYMAVKEVYVALFVIKGKSVVQKNICFLIYYRGYYNTTNYQYVTEIPGDNSQFSLSSLSGNYDHWHTLYIKKPIIELSSV